MSDTDFSLTPGFKQLEMQTAGLSVLPCCSPCLPWQQESSAWVLGVHLTFCEESLQLYLERFPSNERDTEFSLVWSATHQVTTSPRLWRRGVTKGRNWQWQILFPFFVRAGNVKVCSGQAVNPQTLAEISGAALQPAQAALPACPRLLCAPWGHSLGSALLEGWQGTVELLEWLEFYSDCREYSKCRQLSASRAGFGLTTSSFLCPTEKGGPASSPLAARRLWGGFSGRKFFGIQRGNSS